MHISILFDFHSILITISVLQEENLEAQKINLSKVTSHMRQELNVSLLQRVVYIVFRHVSPILSQTHSSSTQTILSEVLLLGSPVTSTLPNLRVSSQCSSCLTHQ